MEVKYYDLTPAQRILFFSQKYTIHRQVNNICTLMLTDSELDFDFLRKAVEKEYERNDCLRIRIVKHRKEMKQYFIEHEEPAIEYLNFRGKTSEEMDKALYKIAHKRISVFGKSMSKVYMIRSFDGRCGIFFVVSHMIMDSWAITTFYKDVLAVYEAISKGIEMPKPLGSYEKLLIKDLNYKNTEAYKRDRKFFKEILSTDEPIFTHVNGSAVLEKYRKKKRNPDLRYANTFSLRTKADNKMFLFSRELVSRMEAYCAESKFPMQTLVLLAYRSYLSKVNKLEKDICFFTIVARRGTLEEKNSGGSRVHFLPFRTVFEEVDTFKTACGIINEKQAAIFRHASMDSLEVWDIWGKVFNVPKTASYTSTALTFQPVKLVSPNGMKLETRWYGNGALGSPLYLTVMDGDGTGALKFYYEYQPHLVKFETVQRLHSYMMKFIEAGITNENITLGELLKLE